MNKVLIGISIVLLLLVVWLGFLRPDPYASERRQLADRLTACTQGLATATASNETLNESYKRLQKQHNDAVLARAADQAAAEQAAQRYMELETEFLATEQLNQRYLNELQLRDPVAADWLATGVDHAVACRLWPEADYCKGTVPR